MLAQKNEFINEASATIYQLSQEENIRLQCEAREDYYRRQRSVQSMIEEQKEQLSEYETTIQKYETIILEYQNNCNRAYFDGAYLYRDYFGQSFTYDDDGNVIDVFDPEVNVSMNMWGLTPDIFGYLEEDFKVFLDENLNAPKAEFFLPFEVDALVKKGIKKVRVLSSPDRWYGVTYREDKQSVVDAIAEMTAKGMYK